jgi:restriction system protein
MKGILVTTSDYGADSYEFAKGKPLTLINGSQLLSMMQKHGYKARINLNEARQENRQALLAGIGRKRGGG